MNIVCIGGGPAGLYFSLLMKKQNPEHCITVIERNRPYDTFGWGVVFSDQTLGNLASADEPTARAILQAFNHWDDIEIHFKGETVRSGGHGFCGIGRKRLLNILQARCEELGVQLVFETEVQDDQAIARQYGADLVIASDGLNSRIRTRYAASYQPEIEQRHCRFVWLGTRKKFEAFTFAFRQTPYGWFQAHIYQYDGDTSTFIVETPEARVARGGAGQHEPGRGHRLLRSAVRRGARWPRLAEQFAALARLGAVDHLSPHRLPAMGALDQDGVPVVLMGDAAHTAHYSIGSGTKLALEDAIELARCFGQHADSAAGTDAALAAYQQLRAIEVLKIQSAARNSMEWFENVERYSAMEAPQFAYSMLTRSQRISHENLRLRDPHYVADYERWLARRAGEQAGVALPDVAMPPMLTPFRLRGVLLKNRIVVSPMAQYSAVDGVAGDYHLMHLGARAMGGAGLVFAEMTCVSADARITPACPGMYSEAHTQAWRRIVDFVHASSDAKIALQLGHAGPKGSTRPMWDGIDLPLKEDNWPLLAASEQQYLAGVSQTARAATESDLARIEQDFVRATLAAAVAGFDWLELHCAHGYLLSSFISPLTNRRTDEYGGSLENRCRYPLRVFRAMRAAWPQDKPMSVRISAHDWVEGGITPDDAVRHRAPVQAGRRRPDRLFLGPGQQARTARVRAHVPGAVRRPRAQRGGHRQHGRRLDLRSRPCQQHHRRRARRPVRRGPAAPGQPGLDPDGDGAHRLQRRTVQRGRNSTGRPAAAGAQSAARAPAGRRQHGPDPATGGRAAAGRMT